MLKNILLVIISFLSLLLNAQHLKYSRAEVLLDASHSIKNLASLGVAADHGKLNEAHSFTTDFSELEISKIRNAGFNVNIIIDDVSAFYVNQNAKKSGTRAGLTCDGPGISTPEHYEEGGMGGYFTYEELLQQIDLMKTEYPGLVKAKQPISTTINTFEGRPLYWLKISDNPDQDEAEPEVLMTSLHHAREPLSASHLVFFCWYLLENYEGNEEIRNLLNETELFLIPCVNPDGYIFNQTEFPEGGGMWRKNRRLNADGSYGVDLNRNYGISWGSDDEGSSPDPSSETYRGTAPFSEAETQLVKLFCEEHEFQIAYNNHTFSDVISYSYSYFDDPEFALLPPTILDLRN